MAFEIHHIDICIEVTGGGNAAPKGEGGGSNGAGQGSPHWEALVQECVKRVLRAVNKSRER